MIEIKCDNCGKIFKKYPYRIKSKKHFCSIYCKCNYNSIKLKCPICNKRFKRPKCHLGKINSYCSIKCSIIAQRKHKEWTPKNTNDGYIDSCGRFRVYLPSHHRSYIDGYILRSIVHYEYYNNDKVTIDFDIHHKDKNRLNDSKENLQKIDHVRHLKLHNPLKWSICICKTCKKEFKIKPGRLNEKGENRGSYCSQDCYQTGRKIKNGK